MTGWGDRLIACAATLAAVAVIGALTVVLASFLDPHDAGPTPIWLAVIWTFGIAAQYSPLVAWVGVLVLAALVPWLAKQPVWMWALVGAVLATPAIYYGGTVADHLIRFGIGALYGETFRRLIAFELRTYFERSNRN
jgi:hypothetical protein